MKFYFFGLLFLSNYVMLEGQDLAFQQYLVEDGLPSAYIYDVVQGKDGHIWISTEAGLAKFDGHQFIKSPIKGLNEKEIIHLNYDSEDRLWMVNIANEIYYYENGKVEQLHVPNLPNAELIVYIEEDNLGNYWILSGNIAGLVFLPKEKLKTYEDSDFQFFHDSILLARKQLFSIKDSLNVFMSLRGITTFENGVFKVKKGHRDNLEIDLNKQSIAKDDIITFTYKEPYPIQYNIADNSRNLAFPQFQDDFTSNINDIHVDGDNENIWIATDKGLILISKLADGSYELNKYLKGKFITKLLKDHTGGYWITTQRDGLYYLPAYNVDVYNSNQFTQVSALSTTADGNIIIGSDNNRVDVLDSDFQLKYQTRLSERVAEIYDIVHHDNETFFFTSMKLTLWDKNYQSKDIGNPFSYKAGKRGEEGKIWMGTSSSILYKEKDKYKILGKKRTYAVFPIAPNDVLFGTVDGLYRYNNETLNKVDSSQLNFDIRDIYVDEEGTYYLATQNEGLIIYKNNKIYQHIKTEDGLSSNNCKKILVKKNIAWVATNKGINKIDLESGKILVLNNDDGLPDNEVNYLCLYKDSILLAATNKGVAYFNENINLKQNSPNTIISNLKILDNDTTVLKSYDLSYSQTNIKIEYSGICFRHAADMIYEYKMEGLEKDWITTSFNNVQYPNLPSGTYTFFVRSKTVNSEWSLPASFELTIDTPFWERIWFYALVLFVLTFLLYLLNKRYLKNKSIEAEAKQKLKASQLTALRAQMNPHFMFNALNSIQEFIITKDKRLANRYLSQFSRLMRIILEMSDKDWILLNKELEALELYLSLEALRFEKDFEYEIELGDEVDIKKTYIPSMLVQPYVENAIKHGLHHKKEGLKKVIIRFQKEQKHLLCEIEDNGVGRAKVEEIKKNNSQLHGSKGMNLTEERLKLLDSAYKQQLNVEIYDLQDLNGNATGTKVNLRIKLQDFKESNLEIINEND